MPRQVANIDYNDMVGMTCANVSIEPNNNVFHSVVRLYRSGKQSETVKPTTHLFCSFTINETNFVLILVVHSLQYFLKSPPPLQI